MSQSEQEEYEKKELNQLYGQLAKVIDVFIQELENRNLAGMKTFYNELYILYSEYSLLGESATDDEQNNFSEAVNLLKETYLVGTYEITSEFCEKICNKEFNESIDSIPDILELNNDGNNESTIISPYFSYDSSTLNGTFTRKTMPILHLFLIGIINSGIVIIFSAIFLIIGFIKFIINLINRDKLPGYTTIPFFITPAICSLIASLIINLSFKFSGSSVFPKNAYSPVTAKIYTQNAIIIAVMIVTAIIICAIIEKKNKKLNNN